MADIVISRSDTETKARYAATVDGVAGEAELTLPQFPKRACRERAGTASGIAAIEPDLKTAEMQICIAFITHISVLGPAESVEKSEVNVKGGCLAFAFRYTIPPFECQIFLCNPRRSFQHLRAFL